MLNNTKMDNLLKPEEVEILIDQIQKKEGHHLFFETCKNRFIFYNNDGVLLNYDFSLVPKDGYHYDTIHNAIQKTRAFRDFVDAVLYALKKISNFYYAINRHGDIVKNKKFSTREEAISFVKDYINKVIDADEPLDDIVVLGCDEEIPFRKEEFAVSFPELEESIKNSKYKLKQISIDILKKEFFDCYVMDCVVSYENYGWAGYLIESKAMSRIKDWKNEDRVNAWHANKKRIKNIPDKYLGEIISQINL